MSGMKVFVGAYDPEEPGECFIVIAKDEADAKRVLNDVNSTDEDPGKLVEMDCSFVLDVRIVRKIVDFEKDEHGKEVPVEVIAMMHSNESMIGADMPNLGVPVDDSKNVFTFLQEHQDELGLPVEEDDEEYGD